jgi:hypothetical protein
MGSYANASPSCTPGEARKAEAEASSLRTWQQVFYSYQRYRKCDDGAISEGYSNSVASLLAAHWEQNEELLSLVNAHPQFERFVIRHLDDTMTRDQDVQIHNNIQHLCPPQRSRFCAAVRKRFAELNAEQQPEYRDHPG